MYIEFNTKHVKLNNVFENKYSSSCHKTEYYTPNLASFRPVYALKPPQNRTKKEDSASLTYRIFLFNLLIYKFFEEPGLLILLLVPEEIIL